MSMSRAAIPTFEIGLNALSAVLDKAQAYAEAKRLDPAELQARITKTIAFLKTLDAAKIDGSADREITFPLGPQNKGHMRGADYLNHFVLPNFYFHLTTAYDILRHCGVEIGKRDFIGNIPMRIT